MTAAYTRRGLGGGQRPQPDIYDIPTVVAPDDGCVILHVGPGDPACADCGAGHLRWAEAGYIPWHRICDACGSHWDLHPLGMGIGIGLVDVPDEAPGNVRPTHRVPSVWVDGHGWRAIDPAATIKNAGTPWGALLALLDEIPPAVIEEAARDRGHTLGVPCIPAAWARRAQFFAR